MPISIPIISAEQVKKADKQLSIPIISTGRATSTEPTGPRPVIPTGNTCCTRVCTIINGNIEQLENDLKSREEQFSTMREGYFLERVMVVKPKKGELEAAKKAGRKKVETEEVEEERRVSIEYSQGRYKLKKQIEAITNQLTSLKDFRVSMRDKGHCKCIEDIKFNLQTVPLTTITEMKK
jgi:hypothetical protein